jgi:hypothetical protein
MTQAGADEGDILLTTYNLFNVLSLDSLVGSRSPLVSGHEAKLAALRCSSAVARRWRSRRALTQFWHYRLADALSNRYGGWC